MRLNNISKSGKVLILANVLVIALAIIEKWSMPHFLLTYWCQNVIIGLFMILRILTLSRKELPTSTANIDGRSINKYLAAIFFTFHYGLFHLGYLAFLSIMAPISILKDKYLVIGIAIFFLNHLFSFLYNRKNYPATEENVEKIATASYERIFPMHITIIIAIPIVILFKSETFVLLFFLLVKTFLDVLAHETETRQA